MPHGAELRDLSPDIRAFVGAEAIFVAHPVRSRLLRGRARETVDREHDRFAPGPAAEIELLLFEIASGIARNERERAGFGLLARRQIRRRAHGVADLTRFEGGPNTRPDILRAELAALCEEVEKRRAVV